MESTKKLTTQILRTADIRVNGPRPWDIQVHDERFYPRVFREGSLGLGESYMDGWWDSAKLDEFFYRLLLNDIRAPRLDFSTIILYGQSLILNMQSRSAAKKNIAAHYDLPNAFFELFLGPYNQYTSLYYRNTDDFEKAELDRLDLICRKLYLSRDDRLLDIGCGWGGFAEYAARRYGCQVTGISISREQIAYAKKRVRGLPVKIEFRDYRDMAGTFSKITASGMIEHVGYKNYQTYMRTVHRLLADNGLFMLDCLGDVHNRFTWEPWLNKYIFPNGQIPSQTKLVNAIGGLFVIEDWHNFGVDYAHTDLDWFNKFHKNWKQIQKISPRFDDRFYRMWKYYLLSSVGALRSRTIHQWQLVLSKRGLRGGYASVR